VKGDGAYRVQVGGRHAPRAARPRDGVAGPHPHVDRDGRGDAEAEEVEVNIDPNDLKIDVYRSTGPAASR
jgi:Protein chain release factor A